jgi:hypothetical protein
MTGAWCAVPVAARVGAADAAPAGAGPAGHLIPPDLPGGCYHLAYQPAGTGAPLHGTLRMDRDGGTLTVSGDLYLGARGRGAEPPPVAGIPTYPRGSYHSYLRGTAVTPVAIELEQYDYAPPGPGSFNGTFPAAPGSRTVSLRFGPDGPSPPGPAYRGDWLVAAAVAGTFRLCWISPAFRRCTIEVDTVAGAVAPGPVPDRSGTGLEGLDTILASGGWAADIRYDQTGVPVPADVPDPGRCWDDAQLHALMSRLRQPAGGLDADWLLHLLVVPGRITCARGKMYDTVREPREGVAVYSDDGFPRLHSRHFGAAEGRTQREVPRAFLRTAGHEILHGLNQIHPEQEDAADNSIMTTTADVAALLGLAGAGGTGFPDGIDLTVNPRCRHRLVHLPDPVVRPGGHTFASWGTPAASPRDEDAAPIEMSVRAGRSRVMLGEPLPVSWTVTNRGARPISVPDPVTAESTYALVTVTGPDGRRRPMPPLVVECDAARIRPLPPGRSRTAGARLFWSSTGFAFDRPGRHAIEVRLDWAVAGARLTASGTTTVRVDPPAGAADRAAAELLLDPEVGAWVALGGGAAHLTGAVGRLRRLHARGGTGNGAGRPAALRGFPGPLP